MELKPIRTKKDYQAALAEVDRLWDAPAKSPKVDKLDVLTMLIEDYERQHYPIPAPEQLRTETSRISFDPPRSPR